MNAVRGPNHPLLTALACGGLLCLTGCAAAEGPAHSEKWDYAPAMQKVASHFQGRPGVVLHIGDSITYSNPYGQWARLGKGKTADDEAALKWMHCGADNDQDGWWLARFDHPAGGRSYTACGGLCADELLNGGTRGMPPLSELLKQYRPQIVVLMLGTNDATANRPVAAYRADMARAVDAIINQDVIPIVSTIPPHPNRGTLVAEYNEALRAIARTRELPLIDFEKEILSRRPHDWNGTLLVSGEVHPSAEVGKINSASAPTEENLRSCGYLLRGWLSVRKISEVKRTVIDAQDAMTAGPTAQAGTPAASRRQSESEAVANASPDEIRLPVVRDTWFSNVGSEATANLGGADRLKVKSIQEMSLLDIDPEPLKGRVIRKAALHVRPVGSEILHRITVSGFASPWVEGSSSRYAPEQGSSCFNFQRFPGLPWTGAGSDLTSVMLGQGGTLWGSYEATPPDADGWQQIPIHPPALAARIAGLSYGLIVFDDTGSEWTRDGEQFKLRTFPNRFFYSRHAGAARAPYVTVEVGPEDHLPPLPPTGLRGDCTDLPVGSVRVQWITPADQGPAGTLGFLVDVDGRPVPRYLIPAAGAAGRTVTMRLDESVTDDKPKVTVSIRAVDAAGNVGSPVSADVAVSQLHDDDLPGSLPEPFRQAGPLPRVGNIEIAVVDALDKFDPQTGQKIPPANPDYLAANHVFSARDRLVRLSAARNEFVDFQVLLHGPWRDLESCKLEIAITGTLLRGEVRKYCLVSSKQGLLPDPLSPVLGERFAMARGEEGSAGAWRSLHGQVYVPHELPAGDYLGKLVLGCRSQSDGAQRLEIPVSLHVWDFTLPDRLSFIPEMNCYGLPPSRIPVYRLGHVHRTVVNCVPYSQSGHVADDWAVPQKEGRLDWKRWDAAFGPLLDGSAFSDLPRKGVPLECFYLPLHENWPTPMQGNYNGDYWADKAFPPEYRRNFVDASRQFAEHFDAKGWHGTIFQCFLNNKIDFKRAGWSRGSSPWLFDEPANFQDYWALRYFGDAFQEGLRQARGAALGRARLVFRADISRPEWQRDVLDPVLNYNVVGNGPLRRYHDLVMARKEAHRQTVLEYGSTNAIEVSNVQPVAWCVDSWTLGAEGVVPWQTIGTANSWHVADPLAVLYPPSADSPEWCPSIRLKAYCRGQQDVEYLVLLARILNKPQWEIGAMVRRVLHWSVSTHGTGAAGEDAGVLDFGRVSPQELWALRVRVATSISQSRGRPNGKSR